MSTIRSPEERETSNFDTLLTHFSGMVRQVGWRHRLCEADIDELVQDVRIRLWKAEKSERINTENIEHTPASYVYRTATTAALDLIRRRRSGRALYHESVDDFQSIVNNESVVEPGLLTFSSPDQDLAVQELADVVDAALATISENRRPVVRMYLAGYPREEIAKLQGWSEAKTRNLLYRGLADLREKLLEKGIGPGGAHDSI